MTITQILQKIRSAFYTKAETDAKLNGKSNTNHNHNSTYLGIKAKAESAKSADSVAWENVSSRPTKVSQLTNDSGFITGISWDKVTGKPTLATVATSGSYNDLSNKPTIPTVNNATLTIQKNGTNVQTFTANSSSNKTANITVPTKVSELTNDSKFVNTTQLAAKADDADVVHKSGDEDINGTKSFKTMPKIAGAYFGNEASSNERSCLYLTSNRDTIDKSGAYIVRFRQNRDQGALEGVSYISQDILENGTRYPRVLVSGLAFGSDFTPSYYYLSSQSSIPSQLGREDLPWSKAFLTDCSIGNTLAVKGDVWVGGDQLMITSDETEVFTGRRISWAKNADTLPTKAYNLNFSLGGNNSAGWANRIGGFRVALSTIGDVETAMYAHDTTGASKGQSMIGIYYKRETDSFETIAPTPPAGDNSTQIATTAWVTAKDNNVVHKTGNETVKGVKTFTRDDSNAAIALSHGSFKKGDASDVRIACLYTGDGTSYANSLSVYDIGTSDSGNITATSIMSIENTAGESGASKRTNLQIVYHKNPTDGRKQYATLSGDFLPSAANTYTLGSSSFKWKSIYGNLVGNADTATQFSANKSVTLTGDVTGTASSKGGWSVTTTLANSGVTAGTYGPSKNVTGNNNATISVPQITVDAKGRVTSVVNRTLTCKNNTYTVPTKVSQLTNDTGFITSKGSCASATKSSYLDNYSKEGKNKIYLDWDGQVNDYVGLKVDDTAMGGLITTKNIGSQSVNSATYATTQATTDNSTKIATTAWVRTYVNSVVGSGSVGASISAYYSNATTVTAEGGASSSSGSYPSDYSDYINISPKVGTIYTGSQLFGSLKASASGSKDSQTPGGSGTIIYSTTAKATATFSGAFSSSAKYLCTTANAVKFRAFVSQGTTSNIGTATVKDNSSAKSIFIRVQ